MKRRGLFLDTGVLLAAVVASTSFARRPSARRSRGVLHLAFGHEGAPPVIDNVLRVHGARFAAALDRYQKGFDGGLSFTDRTSVVLTEDERLGAIATFDRAVHGVVPVVDSA